ncbi:uncharacterized protein LOC120265602 [Dioscorea cayenensis subsp. rotundata]|uniref:Uncharacterized protein LOC120265602 n=1 Tax=Dioscorea cayennensis subsp. rotundata TaxID=55577 RepID=A0AB40BS85_DIOCR|nr:uncharacterized protein LOC120265602 [Dioscorea cayenensis subsp. rotundata]
MVVGGSSSARVHGVDRFYNPPAMRRQLLLQQQKLQEQPPAAPQPQKAVRPRTKTSAPVVEVREAENRAESDDSSAKPSASGSSSSSSAGNLERFLEFTSPSVPAQYFSKVACGGRRNRDGGDLCPFFNLEDLWESFAEWSAYGAGVPLVLNGRDSVVQYYVPYLSALQIYVDSSRSALRSRCPGEESVGDIGQGTSSDGSEGDANQFSRQKRDCPANDTEISNQPERPIFEYLERDPPYGREPLADKISSLATRFPDLKTYRSCDLRPSSWISVAWYPIYRIPIGPTLRDLDACFLTFHLLATPIKSNSSGHNEDRPSSSTRKSGGANGMSTKLHLPVFGLASYKFKGSIWTSDSDDEQQQVTSLQETADKWLRDRQVNHPDFRFFASHLR